MAITLANGTTVSIASGYSVAKNITAITNANPGVATLVAAHGVVAGDILEVSSGWEALNERAVKAGVVATNDVPFLGVNTASVSKFPAGLGAGSIRIVTGFTALGQITAASTDGGEQEYVEYQFLSSKFKRRFPTVRSARGYKFTIAYDELLAGQILVRAADDDLLPRVVKITYPSGGVVLENAYISMGLPSFALNEIQTVDVTMSMLGDSVRV
jgi:hypothetical protein